jgi:DNA-binding MarR family transcriptional regulator
VGELQEKILGHMLECASELENTNHISKALGLAQPTIFKSIRLLEKEKYVQTRQEYLHGIRTLRLTDKGVAAALLSGKEKDKIYTYLQRRAPSSFMLLFMNIVKDKNDLDTEWMRLFIEYMLCQEQNENGFDEKKKEELIAALMVGPMNSFVDAKKLRSNLERYEIFHLIEMLRNKIKSTNSIIDQLMSDELNQDKFKREISSQKWRQSISKQHNDKFKRAITR